MAEVRISEMTAHSTGVLAATDLIEVSEDLGGGLYGSRKLTGLELRQGIDTYKAVISQASTNDPVIEVELNNTLGLTVVPSYVGVGSYQIAGLSSNASRVVEITLSGLVATDSFDAKPTSANAISLRTFSSGVASDGILTYQGVTYPRNYKILTINFY